MRRDAIAEGEAVCGGVRENCRAKDRPWQYAATVVLAGRTCDDREDGIKCVDMFVWKQSR